MSTITDVCDEFSTVPANSITAELVSALESAVFWLSRMEGAKDNESAKNAIARADAALSKVRGEQV